MWTKKRQQKEHGMKKIYIVVEDAYYDEGSDLHKSFLSREKATKFTEELRKTTDGIIYIRELEVEE
jgi:hypothetical protein